MQDYYSFSTPYGLSTAERKYCHTLPNGTKERWHVELAQRVGGTVMGSVNAKKDLTDYVIELIAQRKFIPGGRYLYATGRPFHQTQNCLLKRVQDSRDGWATMLYESSSGLMTGAGIGNAYGLVRPKGFAIRGIGGIATGPLALMQIENEAGRGIMQGGSRRSAIWAGLPWWHNDCNDFIVMKNWSEDVKAMKAKDYNFPATMDMTNISVQLDDEFFELMEMDSHFENRFGTNVTSSDARERYWKVIHQMLSTGEPGFSVDVGENRGEDLRNACTEVTSADDNDICNLGSINMARIESHSEMCQVVEAATAFLLAGTVYSSVPYEKVAQVREKNRRLGLGLMGIHEWLMIRGKKYGPDKDLERYLETYKTSGFAARMYAKEWGLSVPVKTRAIAPTGTIGIVAETTTGIEPIFAAAYKRRYLQDGSKWSFQYVVDGTAKRVIDQTGIHPDDIEDAYSLASDCERRVSFQAWVQQYVDHGISSTINLPQWGTPENNEDKVEEFGNMLLKYLPKLRGITVYPDGARGGQPLNAMRIKDALKHEGEVFYESGDVCDITKGGSCGE